MNQERGLPGGKRCGKDTGSVLIVALWSLFFLGALALAIGAYLQPQLRIAAKLKNKTKIYYVAKAGVKSAVFSVEKERIVSYNALNEKWSSNEAGFKKVKLDNGYFSVRYELPNGEGRAADVRYGLVDEERKININKASYAVLKSLFEVVGKADSEKAAEIAASIIDWRDKDEEPLGAGAETAYYLMLEPSYSCKNKDFEVLEELLLVKGMNQELFNAVKDRITIYTTTGAININTADELVLQSLGMDSVLAKKIVVFRNGNDGIEATDDDNVFKIPVDAVSTLSQRGDLSKEEIICLNNIISEGLLCSFSDNFMGQSIGYIDDEDISAKITFVFGRNRKIKRWREE